MPTKQRTAKQTAKQADYKAWKWAAAVELVQRHNVRAGIIPERVWRQLYLKGRSPQDAADAAAVSAYSRQAAADRLRKR
jgi:hypothetical protein